MAAGTSLRRLTPSTLVSGMFVLAAAAITWFGITGGSEPVADSDGPIVTVAGDERPTPASAVAGVSLGGLPTRVVIPSAGVDTQVSEVGVTFRDGRAVWETAWRSAGHHIDSAMPGQPGNMVITGHVSVADSSNVAVFRHLADVGEGDIVEVYSGEKLYRYSVSKVIIVPPSAVKLLRSNMESTLTLVTCTPDLKNRLLVVGTLVG